MRSEVEFSETFSSAHFYKNESWSDQKNRAEFGRCFTEFGHGHNYRIQASFLGTENSVELEKFARALHEEVDHLDHQHLNFDVEEFKTKIPTSENIAAYLLARLQKRQLPVKSLRLYETEDLWVEVLP